MEKEMSKEEMYKAIIEFVEKNSGFMKYNKMHVEELKDNYAKMSVWLDENSMNPMGIAHGGLLFGLADSTMGMAARTNGANAVTINSQIDYIRPGKGKKITAIATPLKVGKSTAVYRCELYRDDEELCASVTATYYFLNKEI